MRYITERELRDCFARGVPETYDPPADARLTPAARQYLMDLRLYRTGSFDAPAKKPAADAPASKPDGAVTKTKPEYMTHLTANELTLKNHPRIILRGKLDSLEAEVLMTLLDAPFAMQKPLEDALSLIRRVLAADFKETPLGEWTLDNMSESEVHRASHHPEEFGFKGHLPPSCENGRLCARVNRLRTQTREVELCAVTAFQSGSGVSRADLVLALNRLSSYFYVLQLRAAAIKG